VEHNPQEGDGYIAGIEMFSSFNETRSFIGLQNSLPLHPEPDKSISEFLTPYFFIIPVSVFIIYTNKWRSRVELRAYFP
jgi:hypothetical protein